MSDDDGSPSLAPRRVRLDDLGDLPASQNGSSGKRNVTSKLPSANATFAPISYKELEMQARVDETRDISGFCMDDSDDDYEYDTAGVVENGAGDVADEDADEDVEDDTEDADSDADSVNLWAEAMGTDQSPQPTTTAAEQVVDDSLSDSDDGMVPSNPYTRRQPIPSGERGRIARSRVKRPRVGAACVFDSEEDTNYDRASVASDESLSRSSASRGEWSNVFPDAGVRCVGCNLCHSITKVDQFIEENLMRADEDALFKLAALVYKREVVAPVTAEGNQAPEWGWRDIQTHYTYHAVNHRLKRKSYVNQLTAVRMHLERGMVRITDNDGEEEREVDGSKVDRYLKVVALESKERQLLGGPAIKETRR